MTADQKFHAHAELLHELDVATEIILHGGYDEQMRGCILGTMRDAYVLIKKHEHLIRLAKASAFEEAADYIGKRTDVDAIHIRRLLDKAKQAREGAK